MSFDLVAETFGRANIVQPGWGITPLDYSQLRFGLVNPVFGDPQVTVMQPIELDSSEFENDTDAAGQQQWTSSKTYTATATFSLTDTITNQSNATFTLPIPRVGNILSFGDTTTMSYASTQIQMTQQTQTFSQQFNLQVPPRTTLYTFAMLSPQTSTIPFTATVNISGIISYSVVTPTGLGVRCLPPIANFFRPRPAVRLIPETPADGVWPSYCSPNDQVQVNNDDSICVQISGKLVGIVGTNVVYKATPNSPNNAAATLQLASVNA